jgi:hypothetical protein
MQQLLYLPYILPIPLLLQESIKRFWWSNGRKISQAIKFDIDTKKNHALALLPIALGDAGAAMLIEPSEMKVAFIKNGLSRMDRIGTCAPFWWWLHASA